MSSTVTKSPTPDEALARLMAGNQRYVAARAEHPRQDAARRRELSGGQNPFAIILGCSDSRVAPELIFDQGLGDLFIIRVAGNVVDDLILGSIEYAAEHLHTPLMVVLGHSKCGAVLATVAGGELDGHLPELAEAIQPAVERAKAQEGDLINNSIRENVLMVAEQLRESQPIMAKLVKAGKLKVVAARYDLDSGQVALLT
jgi:carbonic anhydrase